MVLPIRKHPRLKNYDYQQCGCYHITLCTKNRLPILSDIVPAKSEAERPTVRLSPIGEVMDHYIRRIGDVYIGIEPIKYVIMPNHVHLLLSFTPEASTDVPTVVRSLKRMVSKTVGKTLWQESFFDVAIRNDVVFRCEWEYIDANPDKWAEDSMYVQ